MLHISVWDFRILRAGVFFFFFFFFVVVVVAQVTFYFTYLTHVRPF